MNIFIRELKAHKKSLIIWCIVMVALIAVSMNKFQALSTPDQSINDVFKQMPKSIQVIFGLDSFDISKGSGYFGMLFLYLVIMTTIHAAMLGANIISKEEKYKTSEFLFVKPVTRSFIITSKLAAAYVNILVLNIVTLLSSVICVNYFVKDESFTEDIVKLMTGMLVLQIIFMVIGTGIASLIRKPKTSASIATGILLAAFILYKVIDLNQNLAFLRFIIPFEYFDAKNLMYGGSFDIVYTCLSFVIIAVFCSITYAFYKKRDLAV